MNRHRLKTNPFNRTLISTKPVMTLLNKIEDEDKERNETHVDDVLTKFSIFGRYYLVHIVLTFFLIMSNGIICSNYVFAVDKVSYRCKDERFLNSTCGRLFNSTEVCTEWIYDDPNSFVAEFQLACQEWKRTLVGSVHNFGYGVGLLIVGPLSDRIGRKKTIVITGVLGSILGVTRSFSLHYWFYIVMEFLEAAFGDCYSPAFILMMEMVPHNKRVLSKMMISFGLSLSYATLPLLAYLFPYWRNLLRVIYGPCILFFFYTFILDESPRWLLNKNKKDDAIIVLNKIARKNKVKVDPNILNNIVSDVKTGGSFSSNLKLSFTSGVLLKRFIMCLIWWTTSSFVNFGLRINAVLLPGNKYINYGLFMIVDIISSIIMCYILINFRRKVPLICAFIIASVICFGQAIVPSSLAWLSITLFLFGKLTSSAFFNTTYIYTSEIFPTSTRNSMHALCSAIGRVGSVIAPQTPLLMEYWVGLPSLMFGCASLGAGLVTMLAPDTADDELPDTVTQAEAMGKQTITKQNKNLPRFKRVGPFYYGTVPLQQSSM